MQANYAERLAETRRLLQDAEYIVIGGGAAVYFKVIRPKRQKDSEPEDDDAEPEDYEDDGPPWDEDEPDENSEEEEQ